MMASKLFIALLRQVRNSNSSFSKVSMALRIWLTIPVTTTLAEQFLQVKIKLKNSKSYINSGKLYNFALPLIKHWLYEHLDNNIIKWFCRNEQI